MTPAAAIRVVCWLVRDTFRQAIETRVFWLMLGLSGLAVAACLSVEVQGGAVLSRPGENADFLPRSDPQAVRARAGRDGVDVPAGHLSVAFGAFRVPLVRDQADAVHFLHLVLAGAVADTAGLLLALIWTAGFLPSFLAPGSAELLLSRPVPRAALLLGKVAGVLAFVLFQTVVLIGGTWLALGVRTGVWDPSYLWCVPLLALNFAVFFSASALLAAHGRGAVTCALGALLFWLLCWGMNYGRHAVVALPETAQGVASTAPVLGAAVEAGYWLLPKPADFGMVLADAVGASSHFGTLREFDAVRRLHAFHPAAALATSAAWAAAALAWAVRRFEVMEY